MAPVIFLDIDGVLAPRPRAVRHLPLHRPKIGLAQRPRLPRATVPMLRAPIPRIIHPVPVGHLNRLCAMLGAVLVVSSSWRLTGDIRPGLIAAGVQDAFHPDWRTDADPGTRGQQILRWQAANGGLEFVVLDDWPQGLEQVKSRLVVPNYEIGLSAADVAAAAALFVHHA